MMTKARATAAAMIRATTRSMMLQKRSVPEDRQQNGAPLILGLDVLRMMPVVD